MKTPLSLFQNILPAVFATVFLGNSILSVPPYVHRRKDQCQQDTKAAEKGKYGNTLLLGLKDDGDAQAEIKVRRIIFLLMFRISFLLYNL